MLARRNVVLLVLAAGLFAVDLTTRPRAAEAREVLPLFPAAGEGEAVRILVTDPQAGTAVSEAGGGGEAAALELVKVSGDELERAPGAPWRVVSKQGWPAQATRIAFLLRTIENLTTADLLASDAESHDDYGLLEADAARLRIYSAGGTVLADLLQGDSAPGGRATYVRIFGDDRVWRAASLRGRLPSAPEVWMHPGWLPFERAEVVVSAVELSGSAIPEPLRLERPNGGVELWTGPDGDLVSGDAVRALLGGLAALNVSEVQGAGVAPELLGSPRLKVTLERGADDEEWTGYFGAPAAEGGAVPAARSAGDWTVLFPESSIAPLLAAIERL